MFLSVWFDRYRASPPPLARSPGEMITFEHLPHPLTPVYYPKQIEFEIPEIFFLSSFYAPIFGRFGLVSIPALSPLSFSSYIGRCLPSLNY